MKEQTKEPHWCFHQNDDIKSGKSEVERMERRLPALIVEVAHLHIINPASIVGGFCS